MDYEFGTFLNGKYPYVKFGRGDEILVLFPPTRDLIRSIAINPEQQAKSYAQMLPRNINATVYILGYDIHISSSTWCREIAADFHTFFVEQDLKDVILIGISYGGAVAIPFAHQSPEFVKKLILVVSAYGLSDEGVELCQEIITLAQDQGLREVQRHFDNLTINPIMRWLTKFLHFIEWDFRHIPTNSPETLINAYIHTSNYPTGLKQHLAGIQAPTLIIGGTEDQFFSVDRYKETEALIPNAQLILLPNVGHPAPLEKPFKVQKLVADFISDKSK